MWGIVWEGSVVKNWGGLDRLGQTRARSGVGEVVE